MGVADDSGVDAAGRKLGDAAGDVAVGRAIYSDADTMMLIDLGAFVGVRGK